MKKMYCIVSLQNWHDATIHITLFMSVCFSLFPLIETGIGVFVMNIFGYIDFPNFHGNIIIIAVPFRFDSSYLKDVKYF